MPTKLACTGCQTTLGLPDNPPPKVRCPKCKTVLETGGAVATAPAPAAPKPAPPAVPQKAAVKTTPAPPPVPAKAKPAPTPIEEDELEVVDAPAPKAKKPAPRDEDEDDVPRPPKRNSRRDEEDDAPPSRRSSRRRDDDEEDDDRPRKKKSRRDDDEDDYDDDRGLPADVRERADRLSVSLKSLTPALKSKIDSTVNKREEIVMVLQPMPKVKMWRAVPVAIFGGIFAVAGAVFVVVTLSSPMSGAAFLIPSVFVLVGLAMCGAPFFAMANAKNTAYVITTRRAIVFEKQLIFGINATVYNKTQVANGKKQHSWMVKGAGDIVLREELHLTHHHNRRGYSHTSQRLVQFGIMAVADVDEVEELLHEILLD